MPQEIGDSSARLAAAGLPELGEGLAYLCPADPVADLRLFAGRIPVGPLVLDLRRVTFTAEDSRAWLAALPGLPAGKTICIVLISPTTPPDLLARFAAGLPGCLTIGRVANGCHPDVAVATTADAEQRAIAAYAAGTPLATLIAAASDKPRHDEAELAKDHAAGKTPAGEADSPAAVALKPPQAGPAFDAVLQRAVQVHRGLLALGRLPPNRP